MFLLEISLYCYVFNTQVPSDIHCQIKTSVVMFVVPTERLSYLSDSHSTVSYTQYFVKHFIYIHYPSSALTTFIVHDFAYSLIRLFSSSL